MSWSVNDAVVNLLQYHPHRSSVWPKQFQLGKFLVQTGSFWLDSRGTRLEGGTESYGDTLEEIVRYANWGLIDVTTINSMYTLSIPIVLYCAIQAYAILKH